MKLNKRILNKGLYFILLGAGLSLGTVSCSDYLDTEPITDRPVEVSETPYTKASEAEDLMKTMYVGPGFGHSNYWQLDYFANGSMQTDEAYVSGDNQDNRQQAEYRILSTNGNVKRNWEAIYELINNCNKVLNFVDGIKDPALTAERKAEMKAEAAIVRALYYFHAVQLWGDVPLVTKSVTSVTSENFDEVYSQIYPARKTKEEVYSFIISDLEGALAAAPNASVSKYRATKGVAHALLAKVYATKPNPDYNKVIQHVDQLAGNYSLLPDYNQLFDGNHNANVESILEINSDASNIWWWGTGMFIGDGWQRFNLPTHDLVNAFDAQNDNIRKTNSIKFDIGVSDAYWTDKNNYPFAYKQRIQDGTQHIYILRYADLLLLKAEAKVKLGDFTGAAALVNQVRGRVSLNPITITSETDGINKILKERLLELAFEGQRWFDLKRTGKALEVIKARTDGKGNKLGYVNNLTEQRLLWPVPQSQLDKNPNLTQNPGY
jgi:hypothetical protein